MKKRRGEADGSIVELVIGFAFGVIITFACFYNVVYDAGVIDHAEGRAVVDTLSNGQKVVTRVEAKK